MEKFWVLGKDVWAKSYFSIFPRVYTPIAIIVSPWRALKNFNPLDINPFSELNSFYILHSEFFILHFCIWQIILFYNPENYYNPVHPQSLVYKEEMTIFRMRFVAITNIKVKPIIIVERELIVVIVPLLIAPST